MKKKGAKLIGWNILFIGMLALILLFAKGFHFISIDNEYFFASCVFIAISFPSIAILLIKKNKP